MFLQAVVLVFSGFATYHPELRYRKGGLEVVPYAYPLTAAGTVILVLGMLICSYVVERSTKEKLWIVNTDGVKAQEKKMVEKLKNEVGAAPEAVGRGEGDGANGDGSARDPREMRLAEINQELEALGESERRAGILWLQAGGNVNDQVFDSYAIFAHGSRNSVLTSRLATDALGNQLKSVEAAPPAAKTTVAHTPHTGISPTPAADTSYPPTASNFMQTLAVAGTLISVTGFVTQFTGLRGMHWSATIAQLIATLIMTIVRAWIRRGLAQRPRTDRTPQGHELDWLATRIARHSGDLWPEDEGGHWLGTGSGGDAVGFRSKRCWRWGLGTGAGAHLFSFHQRYHASEEHEVTRIRERIGQLSNWTGTLSRHAISVANAIEVVMNTLFSRERYEGEKRLFWTVQGSAGGDPESLIYFSIKQEKNGRWTASATEIEAVLSMWLYAIHEFEEEQAQVDKNDSSLKEDPQDWLRRGGTALRKTNLRLLGRKEKGYLRDLRWYAGDAFSAISEVEEILDANSDTVSPETCEDSNDRVVIIDQHRVFGFTDHGVDGSGPAAKPAPALKYPAQPPGPTRKRYLVRPIPPATEEPKPSKVASGASQLPSRGSNLQQTGSGEPMPENAKRHRYLAVVSDTPLELCLAQDVFSAFMWAVARKTKELEGKTILNKLDQRATNTAESWKLFTLENATLSRMAKDIERSGLGSLEEIYLAIVPPLSLNQRLPNSLCVVEHAMEVAKPHEAVGHWEDAADAYLWLFRTFSGSDSPVALKAFTVFTMFTWTIRDTVKLWKKEMHDPRELATIEKLESTLQEEAKSANKSWISCLQTVHQLQRRSMDEADKIFEIHSAGPMRGIRPRSFQGFPGASVMRNILSRYWFGGEEINPREKDLIGLTPLHYSVLANSYTEHSSRCLRSGADPDSTDMLGWTPLHYAATYGDERIIQMLFDSRADPTSKDLAGWTPLHAAAWHGNKSVCEMFLQQGARLDILGRNGLGVQHCAAIRGHSEIARRFLEFGANVDIQDNSRRTPLQWAVYYGELDIVRLLVGKGANTTALEANGRTLLHLASVGGWWVDGIFDLIKAKEEDILAKDRLGLTPLHLAVMVGNERAILGLIGRGLDSNSKRSQNEKAPLDGDARNGRATGRILSRLHPDGNIHEAEQLREADRVDALRLQRPTVRGSQIEVRDHEGETPLHKAARYGREAMTRLLLDRGAQIDSPNKQEETPLHKALRSGEEAVVQLLLSSGAQIDAPNKAGETRLHKAARSGEEAVMQLLLDRGGEIDAPNKAGETPLHNAASAWGGERAVELLLNHGAEIDTPNKAGETPLHKAASPWGAGQAVVQLLLDHGAEIGAPNKAGETPLHKAAPGGRKGQTVVQLLLDRGAEVDTPNKAGETPLHNAASAPTWRQGEAVVQLLLDRGAEIDAPNKAGETPLHKAAPARGGGQAVVQLLLDRGAEIDVPNKAGETPLHKAAPARGGGQAVVQLLLDRGAEIDAPNKEGETPLHKAAPARGGGQAVVQLLLDRGAEIDAQNKAGETPLHKAIISGKKDVVQLLLDSGAKITAAGDGGNLLRIAASKGDEAVVRLLLDRGTHVDAPNEAGETPLHKAVMDGKEAVVRLLLDSGATVDAPNKEGATPLHMAAPGGSEAVVKLLLDRGAEIDAQNKAGETPLRKAIISGKKAVVQLLLDSGAKITAAGDGGNLLSIAASDGDEAVVRLLLDRGTHVDAPNEEGETPLHKAIMDGKEAVVRLLLDRGANVDATNEEGTTPLHMAASGGSEAVVRLLLERSAHIDMHDKARETPLHKVVRYGKEAVARLLLDRDAQIDAANNEEETPLHKAIICGERGMVRLLLDCGAKITAADEDGNLLRIAASDGEEAAVRLLLDRGAQIDSSCKEGETALHKAASVGAARVVRLLLDRGAQIEVTDGLGETSLHNAASSGQTAVARLLLDRGSKIDVANEEGETPLHKAAWYGKESVVRLLLDHGAQIDAPNKEGETPLHNAALRGAARAAGLLLDRGAQIEAPNKACETPLHRAAWHGKKTVVRLLLGRGAEIDAINAKGESPLHQAIMREEKAVIRLLLRFDRGANADPPNQRGDTPLGVGTRDSSERTVEPPTTMMPTASLE